MPATLRAHARSTLDWCDLAVKRLAAATFVSVLALTQAPAAALSGYPHIVVPEFTPPSEPAPPAAAWAKAASVKLGWNVLAERPAREATAASISTDGKALFVRFDATQQESIAAAQHTNNVGQGNDDAVWIDLWPNGTSGFFYQFQATPNGTHYQTSSENTSYSPTWESQGAAARRRLHRYDEDSARGHARSHVVASVESAVRAVHARDRRAGRVVVRRDPEQRRRCGARRHDDDAADQLRSRARNRGSRPTRWPKRLPKRSADRPAASVPISRFRLRRRLPFYATFHPDYSNVELDQQSISPTVYARYYYSEVRPFFTQGANFYDQFDCDACPTIQELYTPAIPTPREGYAIEGQQGPLSFATFDALGDDGRSDIASALDYTSTDRRFRAVVAARLGQHQRLRRRRLHAGLAYYGSQTHFARTSTTAATRERTFSCRDQAQRYDFGGGWANQDFGFFGSVRKIGEYYNPADGFISHPGIAGYALYSAKIWDVRAVGKLEPSASPASSIAIKGRRKVIAQSDNSLVLDVLTKSALDLQLFSGSNYWRFNDPLTGSRHLDAGFSKRRLPAHLSQRTADQQSRPVSLSRHLAGSDEHLLQHRALRHRRQARHVVSHFDDPDRLARRADVRARRHGAVVSVHSPNVQWFESVSYAYQITAQLVVRHRRSARRRNAAQSQRRRRLFRHVLQHHARLPFADASREFYLAYGNPNTLVTVPQAIFKVIFYAGAEKGT